MTDTYITNRERANIAQKLRNAQDKVITGQHAREMIVEIADAIGYTKDHDITIYNRLADLIDPFYYNEMLLNLANEIECNGECDGCYMSDGIFCDVQGYAIRRLKEIAEK